MSTHALEVSPGPFGPEWRSITELDDGWREPRPGPRLAELRARGEAFAPVFKAQGQVSAVRTIDLLPFPYPVAFAFWQAAPTRAKYLLMRNRCQLIEFIDFSGARRSLLVNPSEADLSARAGFFEQARRELLPFVPASLLTRSPGPAALLRKLGVDPARIDYVTFDHLHVQDLRRGLGETAPLYPNAKLLVNRRELETLQQIHPLQAPWWISGALDGVPAERVVALEGSVWLGKGLALVWTPGHTLGNHSIVVHAPDGGVYAISENGVAPECYLPAASKIRALRAYARTYDAEVVLNGNTLESALSQYSAMVLEKTLVDRGAGGGELPNILCSSPFVRSPLAWGLAPSHVIPGIDGGILTRSLAGS
jgi:hypothetical protein